MNWTQKWGRPPTLTSSQGFPPGISLRSRHEMRPYSTSSIRWKPLMGSELNYPYIKKRVNNTVVGLKEAIRNTYSRWLTLTHGGALRTGQATEPILFKFHTSSSCSSFKFDVFIGNIRIHFGTYVPSSLKPCRIEISKYQKSLMGYLNRINYPSFKLIRSQIDAWRDREHWNVSVSASASLFLSCCWLGWNWTASRSHQVLINDNII